MDISAGESGWDPEASAALPPRRAPPRLPVLSGKWAPALWPAGAPAVVPAGQGTASSWELLGEAGVGSSAPQGLGTDFQLLYGKVGCRIIPFSPVCFLYTWSIKIIHTFISPLSNELESAVASTYKPTLWQ